MTPSPKKCPVRPETNSMSQVAAPLCRRKTSSAPLTDCRSAISRPRMRVYKSKDASKSSTRSATCTTPEVTVVSADYPLSGQEEGFPLGLQDRYLRRRLQV